MKKFALLLILVLSTTILYGYHQIKIETRLANPNLKFLNADLYSKDTNLPKPVILIQTPYNKNLYHRWESKGANHPLFFDTYSYNFVIMDWRGSFSNKMYDTANYNRGLDGYDAVEWIAKQKWCNGKVGTWGGSALGLVQFQTAAENPPHLVCAAPFIIDYKTKYETFFCGGDYRKEYVQTIVALGFVPNEENILSHPAKDAFWLALEKSNDYPEKFNVPMLIATGWFDHFPGDVIRAFEDIQKRSNKKVRAQHKLLIGPWLHRQIGKVKQGIWKFTEAENEQDKLVKYFFDYYLTNAKNGYPLKPNVTYFEMGSNQWLYGKNWSDLQRRYDTLYLNAKRKLLHTPPPPIMGPNDFPPDTIIFNPQEPSPTFGGARFNPFDFTLKKGPQDISQIVENRSDVIVYTSDYQKDGIAINGSVKVQLYVSSNRKDTDFGVRLTELMNDGSSVLLTQSIKRMRFRESLEQEKLMEKDKIYLIEIILEPLSIQLHKESRLRIVISSSNYPMFDVNLNNGGKLYTQGESLIATNFVYRRNKMASRVIVPHLDKPTNIEEFVSNNKSVEVYPNPASDFIYFNTKTDNTNYEIFNSVGNSLMKGIMSTSIDISQLPTGVYFAKLTSGYEHKPFIVSFCISR